MRKLPLGGTFLGRVTLPGGTNWMPHVCLMPSPALSAFIASQGSVGKQSLAEETIPGELSAGQGLGAWTLWALSRVQGGKD